MEEVNGAWHGQAPLAGNTITFVPTTDFVGDTYFRVMVGDDTGAAEELVTIHYQPCSRPSTPPQP